MIKYNLRCCKDHYFYSWFKDSNTFETLRDNGHVVCPLCGEWQVDRALMAPHLANNAGRSRSRDIGDPKITQEDHKLPTADSGFDEASLHENKEIRVDTIPRAPKNGEPMPSQEEIAAAFQFFAKLKRHVVDTHENVGNDFAEEARKIYYGETRERGIYGDANQDDVEELIEEGIAVLPLPNIRHDA